MHLIILEVAFLINIFFWLDMSVEIIIIIYLNSNAINNPFILATFLFY